MAEPMADYDYPEEWPDTYDILYEAIMEKKMSKNWVKDIAEMHKKFGVNEKVREFDADKLAKFLEFRINFLQEELDELKKADKSEDMVDALIDLCVVAIGTLDAFDVDSYKAWNTVHRANMKKEVGIKESRPNPLGLPDLIKPKGWRSPSHKNNYGLFARLNNKG
jgi:predicted HAD superfamily Cof-like phosphohydrolase